MPSTKTPPSKETKKKILVNRYKVDRKLGSGNFGTVFVVEDLKSEDKWKCLKEIPVGDLQPDETVSAVREARLLSKLDHPGIVKFHDSFIDGEHFCIVTEFCEDGDLDVKISERRKGGKLFDESRIITWFMQLLLAVQYMHERRILHRDLKTRNIFLRNNMIKVGDFGISRILMGTTDIATTFTGTPYYMSPEVLKHEGYNSKSDIWSLGVILYELCSLKRAFEGQNLMGVMFKIVQNDPPSLPKHFSEEISRIYLSILDKDPQKRPSASELLKNQFIVKHLEKRKSKMNGKIQHHKHVDDDSKAIAAFLSASAKKGDVTGGREKKPVKSKVEQLRPMTPGERLKQRKQEKADEEARRLTQITAKSYEESRRKYSEVKSKHQSPAFKKLDYKKLRSDFLNKENTKPSGRNAQTVGLYIFLYNAKPSSVSASLPWSPEISIKEEPKSVYSAADVYSPSNYSSDEELPDATGKDSGDFTSVTEIPDEEDLANTYYSQVDEFEDESSSGSSSLSEAESDDEYGALMQCMGDALDLRDTQTETAALNDDFSDSCASTTMRSKKIESLRNECIRLLGRDGFLKAYDYLNRVRFEADESILSEESIMDGLRGLVAKPRDCFLVDQLLFLEKQEEILRQSR